MKKSIVQFVVRCDAARQVRDEWDVRALVTELLSEGERLADISVVRQELELELVKADPVTPLFILEHHRPRPFSGERPPESTDLEALEPDEDESVQLQTVRELLNAVDNTVRYPSAPPHLRPLPTAPLTYPALKLALDEMAEVALQTAEAMSDFAQNHGETEEVLVRLGEVQVALEAQGQFVRALRERVAQEGLVG